MAFSISDLFGGENDSNKTFLFALLLFGLYYYLNYKKQQDKKAELPPPPPVNELPPAQDFLPPDPAAAFPQYR